MSKNSVLFGRYFCVETVTLLFCYRLTESQTHRLADSHTQQHFSHWSFRSPEDLSSLQTFSNPIGGKNMKLGYHRTSF